MKNSPDFFDLLTDLTAEQLVEKYALVAFFSEKHPLLFSVEFFKKIEAFTKIPVVTLYFSNEHSFQQIIATLEVSFLGERRCYTIKPSGILDLKVQATLSSYLQKYKGPHTVIFFSTVPFLATHGSALCTEIPKTLSLKDYTKVYQWVYEIHKPSQFSEQLFRQRATIDLEQALSLMRYDMVVGKNKEDFFASYIPLLVKHEESLFALSQYFFALQQEKFFTALAPLELVYPIEFWIAFWLEQVWQALIFVDTAFKQGPLAAKSYVSRLPFSFTQKDWKHFSSAELIEAHEKLYIFDYMFKNGVSSAGLHIWYIDFLNKVS